LRFDIRKPRIIGPAIGHNPDAMAAAIIRAKQ
jgi:hypothetical protein